MRLAHPEFLLLLALVPVYVLVDWLLRRRVARRLATWLPAAEQRATLLTSNPARGAIRSALLAPALAFLIVALARPQFGFDYTEVQRRGVDVVLAIDVSASMLARDVVPDRLGQAKALAGKLLDQLGSDRVAVLPFAGSSTLRWPLSFDHGAAKMLIDALDAQSVARGGSGLQTAVDGALKLFTTDEQYDKVLVVFSDGEDLQGGVEEAARRAETAGLIIHTIGIGGTTGVPIPIPGDNGEDFKRDKGQIVYTRLEPEPLQILSAVTGGLFLQSTYSDEEVGRVAAAIAALTGRDLKGATIVRYKERYQWFLVPAVVLIALESAWSRRRRKK